MSEKDITEINIIYDNDEEEINIFGSEFVRNNKNICKMVVDNKEYQIREFYNNNNYFDDKLIIKLKGIDNITNMSNMFYGCSLLSSLPDISKWNTNNVISMSHMFKRCSSLSSLPDISEWNINNVKNMSYMFNDCSSLISLPDISKWNHKNVTKMNRMLHNCSSLITNMKGMLNGCHNLLNSHH